MKYEPFRPSGSQGLFYPRFPWSAAIYIPVLPSLTGGLPSSAPGAQPSENEFAFTHNPLTQGAHGRPGYVEPFQVLNIATAIADEVVMPHASRIESRRAALDRHFTHQARFD